jgi:hypothetical protein
MKMAIKYFIKAPVSEYTDQSGAVKKRYQTIGIVTETKNGDLMGKLEMVPLLGMKEGALWFYLNVPEEKGDKPAAPKADALNDDIPF